MLKWLGFLFRLGLAMSLILAGIGLQWVAGGRLTASEQARAAPEKKLRQVAGEDGPAWVRIRLEPEDPAMVRSFAGMPCLWTRKEGFKTVVEEIKRDGKWIKRERQRFFQDEPIGVPFKLVDGSDTLSMGDWIGIWVADDLVQTRVDDQAKVRELFLPAGADAWACGEFRSGKPHGFIGGRFLLTGLGRERWAREYEGNASWALWGGRGLLLLSMLLLWRTIRGLLHSEPDQATLPAPAAVPNSAKEPPHA